MDDPFSLVGGDVGCGHNERERRATSKTLLCTLYMAEKATPKKRTGLGGQGEA
jgi:hypothetical protein